MKLRILKTHPAARVPEYASEGAAAFDPYAATRRAIVRAAAAIGRAIP